MGFQQFCKTGRGAIKKILMETKKTSSIRREIGTGRRVNMVAGVG
jgi:hypothetical protein